MALIPPAPGAAILPPPPRARSGLSNASQWGRDWLAGALARDGQMDAVEEKGARGKGGRHFGEGGRKVYERREKLESFVSSEQHLWS